MRKDSPMHYFLIDGYNLCFRCFYAMPELTRQDGFPTGALHAFAASILKLSSIDTPHATAVFFDKGGSDRHRKIYPEYKANRSEMPEPLRLQMPEIKRLCGLFGFPIIEENGVEADDLLASSAVKLSQNSPITTIVSADKDFAQLINAKVRQLLPPAPKTQDWQVLDVMGVKNKFGVSPKQIPDFLALVGDAVDNIPGLDGVGPKTAAKWIKGYEDLESIIKRYDWITPDKFRKMILENTELLRRNLELVTLQTNLQVPDFPASVPAPKFAEIMEFFESMQLKRSVLTLKKFAKEQFQTEI